MINIEYEIVQMNMGREQDKKGQESGDKATGGRRGGYGKWDVLTPLSPPQLHPEHG